MLIRTGRGLRTLSEICDWLLNLSFGEKDKVEMLAEPAKVPSINE